MLYPGSLGIESYLYLNSGSFIILGLIFWSIIKSFLDFAKVPFIVSSHLEEYVETLEFLTFSDTHQLVVALEEVTNLLDTCVKTLSQPQAPKRIHHTMRYLDYFNNFHINLISELGSTTIIWRLRDNLRSIRSQISRVRLLSCYFEILSFGEVFFIGIIFFNILWMLSISRSSFVVEFVLFPGIVFLFPCLFLVVRDAINPLTESIFYIEIDLLSAFRERIVQRIINLKEEFKEELKS